MKRGSRRGLAVSLRTMINCFTRASRISRATSTPLRLSPISRVALAMWPGNQFIVPAKLGSKRGRKADAMASLLRSLLLSASKKFIFALFM